MKQWQSILSVMAVGFAATVAWVWFSREQPAQQTVVAATVPPPLVTQAMPAAPVSVAVAESSNADPRTGGARQMSPVSSGTVVVSADPVDSPSPDVPEPAERKFARGEGSADQGVGANEP